jgi:hypothetical protein
MAVARIWSDFHVPRRPCESCDQGPTASRGAAPPTSDRTGAAPIEAPDLHFEIETDLQHLKVWRNGDLIRDRNHELLARHHDVVVFDFASPTTARKCVLNASTIKRRRLWIAHSSRKLRSLSLRRPHLRRPRFSPRSCSPCSVSAFGSSLRAALGFGRSARHIVDRRYLET